MKKLIQSSQYKKDLKKISNNRQKLEDLFLILNYLQAEVPVPMQFRPHRLTGDYKGYMECHVQGDLLLIWDDPQTDEIALVRLGSHSELFGKGIKR